MALKIKCDRCKRPLKEPGALVFSPPTASSRCEKYHVCARCWMALHLFIHFPNGLPKP